MHVAEPLSEDIHGEADDHGRFELACPTGRVAFYARNPDGRLAGYTAVDTQEAREIVIVARPAATARGRVVDEKGKPWASLNVSYCCGIRVADNDLRFPGQVLVTDGEGRFEAPGLPTGLTCTFYAYHPGATDVRVRRG